jgi:hypothetical protein
MQINDKEIHKLFVESVRYSLTRHSYAPSECADLIRAKWGEIPNNTRVIIMRDIDEAINDDNRIDKQYKWPSDIRYNWVSLQNFIRLSESTKARSSGKHTRSLADASGDVGSGIWIED